MSRPTRRILIVEDDFLMASLLEGTVIEMGYLVVGPYHDLHNGLAAATSSDIDFALLDFDLGGGADSTPSAEILTRRGCEFAFVTGTDPRVVRASFGKSIVLPKPVDDRLLGEVLAA